MRGEPEGCPLGTSFVKRASERSERE
jgi:hypothetical protein